MEETEESGATGIMEEREESGYTGCSSLHVCDAAAKTRRGTGAGHGPNMYATRCIPDRIFVTSLTVAYQQPDRF